MIPQLPSRADVDSIATDLGIARESVTNHLTEIGKQYTIQWTPGRKDISVGAPMLSFRQMQKEAEHYFDQVYPQPPKGNQ